MKIYLAADSSLQDEMRELRTHLEERGFTVTSRWLEVELEQTGKVRYSDKELADWAVKDLADVEAADIFICYNPKSHQYQGTGGRHVEFGYAYSRGKLLIYCGEKMENIFHRLAPIHIHIEEYTLGELAKVIAHSTSYIHGYREPSER